MNQDIQRAIEIINQRIANLTQLRDKLAAEFSDSPPIWRKSEVKTKPPDGELVEHGASGNGKVSGSVRKAELVNFLTVHGPSKRSKINNESGIPLGTIANLLTGDDFVRRSDGTWDVKKQPQNELGLQ